jgi:ABC-type multidrug transport system fused ATPase/permease subunit
VIIIAHRLQTVKDADDIILFENGEIKERWNHKELVELKGQYAKMLELQSGF